MRSLSPGPATTRLMKFTSARSPVGLSHAWPAGGWPAPQVFSSAPAGGWKTTTSPTDGFEKRSPIRLTSTRWPIWRVGTIDSEGMRYGLTRKAWMASASPSATATIKINSTSEPEVEDDPFLVVFATSRYSRLACLLVTAGRRLGVGRRLRLGGFGLGDRLLVQGVGLGEGLGVHGVAQHLVVRRGRGLGRRVVQDAALDDLLRTGVAALADAGALADTAAQVTELRAPDVTAGGPLALLDLGRVQRERAPHTNAEGLLADGEGLADPLALALDHHTLEDLRTTPRALDDLEVDLDAIPRLKAGNTAQLRALERVDKSAHSVRKASADRARGRSIMVADLLHAAWTELCATH